MTGLVTRDISLTVRAVAYGISGISRAAGTTQTRMASRNFAWGSFGTDITDLLSAYNSF